MNKNLYLVEGKTDIAKLKSIGADFVMQTDGYNISKRTVEFLKLAERKRKIILLFDPDGPGRMIAKMLSSVLENFEIVKVRKNMCIKKNKVGIAESDTTYLKNTLREYLVQDEKCSEKNMVEIEDLIELKLIGDNSKDARSLLEDKYHINSKSGKTTLRDLNILKVRKEEIMENIYGK